MRSRRRRSLSAPRAEALESRLLPSGGAGLWPLANPSPATSVLIRFRDDASETQRLAAVADLHGHFGRRFDRGPSEYVLGSGLAPSDAASFLRSNPLVLYAEENGTASTEAIPDDPRLGSQWGLGQANDVDVDAFDAWDPSASLPPVVVAVTDTGIDYSHPDLYLNVALSQREIPPAIRSALIDTNGDGLLDFHDLNSLDSARRVVLGEGGAPLNAGAASDRDGNGRIDGGDLLADPSWADGRDDDGNGYVDDLLGWNFLAGTNDPRDGHSHGTHVSGTIAAATDNCEGVAGVNGNARILPLKWISDADAGTYANAAAAIFYAADAGARVINASWSGGSQAVRDAIAHAGTRGAVVVAAAGNYSRDIDATPTYPASYDLPNLVAVAAVTSSGAVASYSNYGAIGVDVGAPGSGILSTIPGGYGSKSGTSMAAPHVAGVASMIAALNPEFSAEQVVGRIVSTSKGLASLAGRTLSGGIVSAHRAVTGTTDRVDPPDPATGLEAAASSSNSVLLSWTVGPAASLSKILRSADAGTTWAQVGSASAGTTTYLDAGLTTGATYSYQVVAANGGGDAAPSNVATLTLAWVIPAAPTRLSASSSTTSKIKLTWVGVSDAASYRVERAIGGAGHWAAVANVAAGKTSWVNAGLASGTTYAYRLTAINPAGESAPSNVAEATTRRPR